jgi:hypothetical protein
MDEFHPIKAFTVLLAVMDYLGHIRMLNLRIRTRLPPDKSALNRSRNLFHDQTIRT